MHRVLIMPQKIIQELTTGSVLILTVACYNNKHYNSTMLNTSFLNLVSLVVLNCLGSGLIMLPPRLAELGINSFWSWIGTGLGALGIGMVFVRLGEEYIKSASNNSMYSIHELISFQFSAKLKNFLRRSVFWGYWLFACLGNAALSLTISGSLKYFFPGVISQSIYLHVAIFLLCYLINRRGIGMSRPISLMLCVIKIAIMVLFPLIALIKLNGSVPIAADFSLPNTVKGMFITLWAFVGIESILMEQEIDLKMIKPAMVTGILICLITYLLNTYVMLFNIPNLRNSTSAYADLCSLIFGQNNQWIINLAIILIMLGSLHGWTITVSSTCSTGKDIVPSYAAKLNRHKVPELALLVSNLLPVGLIWYIEFILRKPDVFETVLDIATTFCLLIYLLANLTFLAWIRRKKIRITDLIYFLLAQTYVSLALATSAPKLVGFSAVLLFLLAFCGKRRRV
jgi:amino acid transporter